MSNLTPAEVLAGLTRQERDDALLTMLRTWKMPRADMTREDYDCVRFADFDEQCDELEAMVSQRNEEIREGEGLARMAYNALPNCLRVPA